MGNIVLLATEQLEASDNEQNGDDSGGARKATATDEELTPLHWLHDKNLLKGEQICVTAECAIGARAAQFLRFSKV